MFSDFWNGSNIHYQFVATNVGIWNVTLVAYDALDNYAVDVVMIEVYEPSTPYLGDVIVIVGIVSLVAVVVVVLVIWFKKKK